MYTNIHTSEFISIKIVWGFFECLGKHYDWPWMWRDQCGMTMSESMPLINMEGNPFYQLVLPVC